MTFKKVSVIGLGYIGLPTAAMLASKKINVLGIDISKSVIDTINKGEIHIVEPRLDAIVKEVVKNGYLKASKNIKPADAFLIAVPTPFKDDSSEVPSPDLSYIKSACKAIAPVLEKGNLVILESTSPVGTTEEISKYLSEIRHDLKFPTEHNDTPDVNIAYCPERVLPGKVVTELVENDRVIGGISKQCSLKAIKLYKIFVNGECIDTDARTAEMVKLAENSSRDVEIAFANELSIICDKLGVNVWNLISLANRHPRVNILNPGPGVGGHCIAVDPWFIVSKSPDESKLIKTARMINDSKPDWVIEKVKQEINNFLQANKNKTQSDIVVCCYGLSFKADIDDLRESPALSITRKIAEIHTGSVIAVEPNIKKLSREEKFCLVNQDNARLKADIKVLLVDHKEFKKNKEIGSYIIDTKGCW